MSLDINWVESLVNIGEALVVALVTSGLALFFTKKYFKQITFANKMKKYGFSTSVTTNDISSKEYKMIFEKATTIRIMYVSANSFFKNRERIRQITHALERGAEVKILLARKDNVFLKDIVNLEVEAGNRACNTRIDSETDHVHDILSKIQREVPGAKLEVRYYSTEYRLPMTIAEFSDKKSDYAMSWLNITLPPYKSSKKFLLRGREDFDFDHTDDGNLVLMMMKHFDSVWELSKRWEETAPIYWQKKYTEAVQNRRRAEESRRILIQASAQHPLKDGLYPDAEFEKRLRMAADLYKTYTNDAEQVKIYVPGSRHKTEKQEDHISLSDAGKTFLIQIGIPENDIYGDDMNTLYKGEYGVYNSADECYVSSQIYKNGGFDRLCCVCSPLQTVKNMLYFTENGVMPEIYAVPCAQQFHNPYVESAEILPDILHYDHSWQGESSFYGGQSRRERKPET